MARSLRLSEKWFNRGLWLVSLVFAGFLIGLGSNIVGDLPQVDGDIDRETFIDQQAMAPLRAANLEARTAQDQAQAALDQANLQNDSARQVYNIARDSYQNWITTRNATQRPDQDAELIARTAQLDELKADQARTQAAVEAQRQAQLNAQQKLDQTNAKMAPLEDAATKKYEAELKASELRVFGYRLALTLPLLALAGWLFKRHRKSQYWPGLFSSLIYKPFWRFG